MNTDSWAYYYKLTDHGKPVESNLIYTPLVSPDSRVMCMHYFQNLEYRPNTTVDDDTVNYFFEREVKYLLELSNFSFTPEVYEVDYTQKKIFIEFPGETFSQIINDSSRNIDAEIKDWQPKVFDIVKTLYSNGYYKLSLYPHCFYISDNIIKTIDYYAVVPKNDSLIERSRIESIIGADGKYRFDQSTNNGMIDFKQFFELTLTVHLKKYWPNTDFSTLYKELVNDTLENSNK